MEDLSNFFECVEEEFLHNVGLDNFCFDANRYKFGVYVQKDIMLWQYN